MNPQTGASAKQLLQVFLRRFPATAPYSDLVIELLGSAFEEVGGDPREYAAVLAENQVKVDRLGDPDSFRRVPAAVHAPQPAVASTHRIGPYGVLLTTRPRALDYAAGDEPYRRGDEDVYVVYQRGSLFRQLTDEWRPTEFE